MDKDGKPEAQFRDLAKGNDTNLATGPGLGQMLTDRFLPGWDYTLQYLLKPVHAPCSQVSSGRTLSPPLPPLFPVPKTLPARTSIFASALMLPHLYPMPFFISGLLPGPAVFSRQQQEYSPDSILGRLDLS